MAAAKTVESKQAAPGSSDEGYLFVIHPGKRFEAAPCKKNEFGRSPEPLNNGWFEYTSPNDEGTIFSVFTHKKGAQRKFPVNALGRRVMELLGMPIFKMSTRGPIIFLLKNERLLSKAQADALVVLCGRLTDKKVEDGSRDETEIDPTLLPTKTTTAATTEKTATPEPATTAMTEKTAAIEPAHKVAKTERALVLVHVTGTDKNFYAGGATAEQAMEGFWASETGKNYGATGPVYAIRPWTTHGIDVVACAAHH